MGLNHFILLRLVIIFVVMGACLSSVLRRTISRLVVSVGSLEVFSRSVKSRM